MNKIFPILLLALIIAACSSSDDSVVSETPGNTSFDRAGMLRNIADNIIVPAYQGLSTNLGALSTAKDDFVATPNQANLETLRSAWFTAYKSWQHVEAFNIGKAEEIQYSFQMNIYPVNTTDVESNITGGSYDLTHPNNNDAVGFPALDYMLYGLDATDVAILEKYTTNTESSKYKTYLSDLVNQMQLLTQEVLSDWTTSYRDIFISSTANTATSATNKFINDFIFYYEKGLRVTKIGIPAGNFSTTPLPEKVEAFYNQEVSKELALEALNAVQNIFNGTTFNGDSSGESFKTYLISLDRADLATLINAQFNTSRGKIQVLNANFFTQINTDNTKMTQAYDALQTTVVSLKVDMLQAFNVSVDYADADGD
ncbi:Iron-regulated protein A [Kordia antarctica]|uniref:Iron-regulated protein A n=1 Tax=Kordia antarctica TaxID=1218801 RepID=A0A7L4ZHF1_9FLAO|nr:imelysin family protein [Kordia antarctica]QHI35911.1 Iron-regulated protein A [Kordia antarctica]